MSWGGDLMDDSAGPTRDFPTLSLVTGLIANAMGWERFNHRPLQLLQDSTIMASRIDRNPAPDNLIDYQTAALKFDDQGWTTHGQPQGRTGDKSKYDHPHILHRHYLQDALATIAIAMDLDSEIITAESIAKALQNPLRPLYIGRRTCIPSCEIYAGTVYADSPLAALFQVPLFWQGLEQPNVRLQWSLEQDHTDQPVTIVRTNTVRDLRNWRSRLHGGHRDVLEGSAEVHAFPNSEEAPL